MASESEPCRHHDIRKFDGLRCCLACGTAILEYSTVKPVITNYCPDMKTAVAFKHADLNFALGQEIRLVSVLPGEGSHPIVCEITHVNLQTRPYYEAVSYTWATQDGDDGKSQKIFTINNELIRVTRNCEAVLRRLRESGLRRCLWVDSICINQENIEERNHQVSLMNQIYSNAARVLICIQSRDHDCSALIQWLKAHDKEPAYSKEVVKAAQRLLKLRWFGRIWVIQEVALAQAAFLVVNNDNVLLCAQVLDRFRKMCRECNLLVPGPLQWNPGEKPETDIITCLSATRSCLSTDPRDSVYAIINLLDPVSRSYIPVDYSSDLKSILVKVFTASIARHQDLRILSYVHYTAKNYHDESQNLLCFVPDNSGSPLTAGSTGDNISQLPPQFLGHLIGPWRSRVGVSSCLESEPLNHDQTSGIVEVMRTPIGVYAYERLESQSSPCLRVSAHYIDTILDPPNVRVFSPMASQQTYGNARHLHINDCYFIRDNASFMNLPGYNWILRFFQDSAPAYESILSLWSIFWCKMLGAGYWACKRQCKLQEVQQNEAPGINLSELISFIDKIVEMGQKIPLATATLYPTYYSIGLFPFKTRAGDAVFAIDGVRSPFVLRKVRDKQYRIIGKCFLKDALNLDCSLPPPGLRDQQPPSEYHYLQTERIEIY